MQQPLTIIIPVFNEEEGIENTITALQHFYQEKYNWKILIVNDGSTDGTAEILKRINGIHIITHPYNKGYGASLKTGIRKAETELIAFYDADGQHRPEDLLNLYQNLGEYDMMVGARGKDSHQDWVRKPGKWILKNVVNFLTGRKIPDFNSGLRMIKREVIIKMLHLFPDGFSFSTTSTVAFSDLGYTIGYLPIVANKRVGKSSVKQLKHGSSTMLLILRLVVLFKPMKVFASTGFFLFVFGVIWELIFGILLFKGPGLRVLPAALLFLLSGILLFFFGLVVDQISELRKHINIKND